MKQKGLPRRSISISDGLTLTSISAYRDLELEFLSDIDRSRFALFSGGFAEDTGQFSQELRLSTPNDARLSAVMGLFYFHQSAQEDLAITLGHDFNSLLAGLLGIPGGAASEPGE